MPSKSKPRPWERQKGEPEKSYGLFLAYRDLGVNRSLAALRQARGEAVGKAPAIRTLEDFSSHHFWVERCRIWDNHLQAERDKVAAKEAGRWEARRLSEVEDVYQLGCMYRELVKQGLKMPLVTRRVETEKDKAGNVVAVTVIEPARWTLRDLAVIGELSARLIAASLSAMGEDPAAMSDAELAAVANAGTFTGEGTA